MKGWLLILAVIVLGACGEADIDTRGQNVQPGKLVEVTGVTIRTPEATIEPVRMNGVVLLDGISDRYPNPMVVTTVETVSLTLSDLHVRFPQEKYYVKYDPEAWIRIEDGQPRAFLQGAELYPEGGWMLRPTKPGLTVVTFFTYDADSSGCATCASDHLYGHGYVFQIKAAP